MIFLFFVAHMFSFGFSLLSQRGDALPGAVKQCIDGNTWSIVTSGHRPLYTGHDLKPKIYVISSMRQCAYLCTRDERCRSFIFSPSPGECELKSASVGCYKADITDSIDEKVYFAQLEKGVREINLKGQPTSESQQATYHPSSVAIDGDINSDFYGESCIYIDDWESGVSPWWRVDIGGIKCIRKIIIYNRSDCCKERLMGAVIRVGWNTDVLSNPICGTAVTMEDINSGPKIAISCDLCGRFISVNLPVESNNTLTLCELQAYEEYPTYSGLSSCAAIRDECDDVSSGEYVIDPDGPGNGVDPFTVLCDMNTGEAIVGHDAEYIRTPTGYEDAGSYIRNISYSGGASIAQVSALAEASTRCEQYIRISCYHAKWSSGGNQYVWWVSRDDEKMVNWGGVPTGIPGCSCSLESNGCYGGGQCNCDENDSEWRYDDGLLTDKDKLPVTQIRSGDTGESHEKVDFILGILKCY